MTVRGYPFDTTDPAGSVTELEWRRLMQWLAPSGVIRGADNGYAVTERAAGANMSVDVATGQAFIVGHYVRSDAVESVAIPDNATGNPRIDTVVVGFDFVANAATVYRVPGVAAAAPAPTELTQDLTTTWEIPLAYVYVAAGENVSITNSEISDRRQYADPQAQQQTKEPVRLVTAAALAASTVTGLVRVANANGALANIDGVAAAVGNRILDKDHATTEHRGIWVIEDVGSASKPWRMRRAPDANESAEVRAGMWVRATEGATLADTGWLLTTNDPIVLGTTGLTFAQFPTSSGSTILWLPAGAFGVIAGTPTLGALSGVLPAWLVPSGGADIIGVTTHIPSDWTTFDVQVWVASEASSGTFTFTLYRGSVADGDATTANGASTSSGSQTISAADTVKAVTINAGLTRTALTWRFNFEYTTAGTLAGNIAVIGIRLVKAS